MIKLVIKMISLKKWVLGLMVSGDAFFEVKMFDLLFLRLFLGLANFDQSLNLFCLIPFFVVNFLEIDMMKERFAKLLLGEDMSGSGKGVCTALAISNAITNLCGIYFLIFEFFFSI